MAQQFAAFPVQDDLITDTRKLTMAWIQWFTTLTQTVSQAPAQAALVSLTAQNDAISTTAAAVSVSAGLYRVTVYARITTPDAISNSLTITIGWTDGGITCSFSGAAMTGILPSTVQSFTFLVQADGATSVTYATAYASNTPNAMVYALSVLVEEINP